MRLSTHLVAVGLAALVPVLGFSALVARQNTQLQLEATERGMRDTAHAVARTVDKQLESAITMLQALAESEHLDPLSLAPFTRCPSGSYGPRDGSTSSSSTPRAVWSCSCPSR